jgi:hypothetical protein
MKRKQKENKRRRQEEGIGRGGVNPQLLDYESEMSLENR